MTLLIWSIVKCHLSVDRIVLDDSYAGERIKSTRCFINELMIEVKFIQLDQGVLSFLDASIFRSIWKRNDCWGKRESNRDV